MANWRFGALVQTSRTKCGKEGYEITKLVGSETVGEIKWKAACEDTTEQDNDQSALSPGAAHELPGIAHSTQTSQTHGQNTTYYLKQNTM